MGLNFQQELLTERGTLKITQLINFWSFCTTFVVQKKTAGNESLQNNYYNRVEEMVQTKR